MKPWTTFTGLAKWLLRIAVLLVIFTQYFNIFIDFKLDDIAFYVSAIYIVFGVLFFAGGFLSKHNLTVISALLLLLVSIYVSVIVFDGFKDESVIKFAQHVMLGAVALFFVTDGNK